MEQSFITKVILSEFNNAMFYWVNSNYKQTNAFDFAVLKKI